MKSLLASIILPPFGPILLGIVGLIFITRCKKTAKILLSISLLLQFLLSSPVISHKLIRTLGQDPPFKPTNLANNAQAIVILGAGINKYAPEYSGPALGEKTLERLSYGAYLAKQTQLPILLTGGNSTNPETQEAFVMKKVLETLFQVPVKWIEGESANTYENAVNSFKILSQEQIKDIVLVTHAWHMPRAKRAFEKAGFTVTPAPTALAPQYRNFNWHNLTPKIEAYEQSYRALREGLGMIWYGLNYGW